MFAFHGACEHVQFTVQKTDHVSSDFHFSVNYKDTQSFFKNEDKKEGGGDKGKEIMRREDVKQ